jgi:hypothetical protein
MLDEGRHQGFRRAVWLQLSGRDWLPKSNVGDEWLPAAEQGLPDDHEELGQQLLFSVSPAPAHQWVSEPARLKNSADDGNL